MVPKKGGFRHLYKMGRPPITISVIVSSTQDSRFVKRKHFSSIPEVSEATGISLRAVRNAYHSGRTSIKKSSGEVYTLKWGELPPPKDTTKCYYCHKALTVKDRSAWFHMDRVDCLKPYSMTFTSIHQATKGTGISNNALRNACEKNNKSITKRKGEFAKYKLYWHDIYCTCKPIDKSKGEVRGCVFPA